VPAYTWGVVAQPISFGHYLLGYAEALARDGERYRQAYARLNMSPLGAAALGSRASVNRPRLAELLGSDGVVENSFDANQISPIDTGIELSSIAASSAVTISTLIADITAQYAQTKPWLLLAEGDLTGGSSIMPQKRNPVGMVRCARRRARLSAMPRRIIFLPTMSAPAWATTGRSTQSRAQVPPNSTGRSAR
jgi:argininosuccinate lyase